MTQAHAPIGERGFTLVEVLIALSIFAMLALAGVTLLRSSITTQASVARQLGDTSELARLRALLAAELWAASPRPNRDTGGTIRQAFVGTTDQMALVYANDAGVDGAMRRATYRLDGDRLVRDGEERVDGATPGAPATIVADISALGWRYRGVDGSWNAQWAPDRPDRLPVAVELTITRRGGPPVTMAFLVAPDGLAAPGTDDDGAGG